MKDTQILQAIAGGDKQALSELYDKYHAAMLGMVLKVVPEQEVAEDILQNVFLKIWHKAEMYNADKSKVSTWLLNISRNAAIDHTRSKAYRQSSKTSSLNSSVYKVEDNEPTDNLADRVQFREQITQLDERLARVVDCVYFKGNSHNEAAKDLDLPLGTIKSRIRKAMCELREMYSSDRKLNKK